MESKAPLKDYLMAKAQQVDVALDRCLPKREEYPGQIHEAMRYAVLNGGKRVRPILTLSICEMISGDEREALIPACAIELIHSYSLIHDDLPCMDNDDMRRGQPTCHRKFGEAMALLAGDALLTLAFHLLGSLQDLKKGQRLVKEMSYASGTFGMIGGQVADILAVGQELDQAGLDYIHTHKTGQLIKMSCLAGAIAGGASQEEELRIIKYGEYLGFAFQIIDDILDRDGYLRFMSESEARNIAREVIGKAKKEVEVFPNNIRLIEISDFILARQH